MIGYLGVPGALVELPYRGGLSVSTDRPVSFTRTMGGKRKAFMGARGRREWDVSFDLIGSRGTHGLFALVEHGGPVMWYPADASAGNLYSPQAAGLGLPSTMGVAAGLVSLPDGSVASAISHTGQWGITPGDAHGTFESVPCTPGELVSFGVWARNGARVKVTWLDGEGAAVSESFPPGRSFTGWEHFSITEAAPPGAVSVYMSLNNGSMYARPSISWGPEARDRPGRGCPKAVVSGLSESLSAIAPGDAYGSVDFTVTEVG